MGRAKMRWGPRGGRLHATDGRERVDGLFAAILNVAAKDKLRCVGLLGAMLSDLKVHAYNPDDRRYQEMLEEALSVFDVRKSKGVDIKTRVDAAEALGQAGDPRLRFPHEHADYWVAIPGGTFTMGQGKRDDEHPHEVTVSPFRLGKFPVTVAEYERFIEDDGKPPPDWDGQSPLSQPASHQRRLAPS